MINPSIGTDGDNVIKFLYGSKSFRKGLIETVHKTFGNFTKIKWDDHTEFQCCTAGHCIICSEGVFKIK